MMLPTISLRVGIVKEPFPHFFQGTIPTFLPRNHSKTPFYQSDATHNFFEDLIRRSISICVAYIFVRRQQSPFSLDQGSLFSLESFVSDDQK
ncbi:hypothetical protein U1Q18_036059 [Sarracenia purpurea var. burkii]